MVRKRKNSIFSRFEASKYQLITLDLISFETAKLQLQFYDGIKIIDSIIYKYDYITEDQINGAFGNTTVMWSNTNC